MIFEINHPILRHKLGLLRTNSLDSKHFREITKEISVFLLYEATKNIDITEKDEKGWAGDIKVKSLKEKDPVIVPVLRAGIGMMQGALEVFPCASVNFIGIYRDHETLKPQTYYANISKDIANRTVFVLDPMLATGGTLVETVSMLKKLGCKNIKAIVMVAVNEGIDKMKKAHPEVDIYAAEVDEELNSSGYILPGLGDAGDRIFKTE